MIRNAVEEDVERIVEIHNAAYENVSGVSPLTVAIFMNRIDHPDISLERDFYVAQQKEVVGYFGILSKKAERDIGKCWLRGSVHPAHQRKGIGTSLMKCALELSRKREFTHMDCWAHGELEHSLRFLETCGFTIVRYVWTMRIQDPQIGRIHFPEGVTVRDFVLGEDEQDLVDIINNSFAEHWGYTDLTLEDVESWKKAEVFDPKGIFFAVYKGEVVGYCIAFLRDISLDSTLQRIGIIEGLGVHTAYRRRGIGKALLSTGVEYVQEKGLEIVELAVDAENPKAKQLYEECGFQEARTGMVYRKCLTSPG
jgi:mycothiol synthase